MWRIQSEIPAPYTSYKVCAAAIRYVTKLE